jgi:hypothetical protein
LRRVKVAQRVRLIIVGGKRPTKHQIKQAFE